MKKHLLIIAALCSSTLSSVLYAADGNVLNMLEELRQESELHHQTKKEDAGIVTLYTREDLVRMQAYTLNDVLKSIPFFTYQEGSVTTSGIALATKPNTYLPAFRLYIDEHEVSSSYFGTAFFVYGDMNLGFVDHIEIYQGGNGIEFGSEPSLATIRIYTKTPSRENGSQLQLLTDDQASGSGYLYHAGKNEDIEYSGYISANHLNREAITYNNNDLSKDSDKSHFLVTLKGEKFNLLLSRYDSLQDGFLGLGRNKVPSGKNEIDKYHQFVNTSYQFSDHIKVYMSIDDSSSQMDFHEENGYNSGASNDYQSRWDENIYKLGLKGSRPIGSLHSVEYGLEYAQKNLKAKKSSYDNMSTLNVIGPTKLDIYSFYFQDTYKVSTNGSFIATFKLDGYKDNGEADNVVEPILRLGYMHRFNNEYKAKLFVSHTYLYPTFYYTTTLSGKSQINTLLKPSHINNFVAEITKSRKNYTAKLALMYADFKDGVFFDPTVKKYANSDERSHMLSASFTLEYKFDLFNSLYFNIYKGKNSKHIEYSSDTGAVLRLLNKYGRFGLFNEMVYRSAYISANNTKIDAGYDYSLGLTYEYNKKLSFNFKAENILDKAIQAPTTRTDISSSMDRTFMLGMEYSF